MTDEPRPIAYLRRLDRVEDRLRTDASSPPSAGLTDPDSPTGERWEYGQVWAHLGEFVPYWIEQVRIVVDPSREDPVPFGRTKTDPERVAAIERDRRLPQQELMDRLDRHLEDVRALIAELPSEAWGRRGLHPTLGVMDVPAIFEEFLVGHLEAHGAQLDGLRSGDATTAAADEAKEC